MGLQHAFAMVGGLITPPLVTFRFSVCGFGPDACPDLEQYAISAALLVSGICTLMNVSQLSIPFSKQLFGRQLFLGSGLLSVMGTSFTFLPVFEISITQMKADGIDGRTAYGKMLGTCLVCCFLSLFLSLLPIKTVKSVFPPLVTSVTIMLIGIGLTGTGMKYWSGGVVCADMIWKDHVQVEDAILYQNTTFPPPDQFCQNGAVFLPNGSPQFLGLGFVVIVSLLFIELFGSVFMKNCNVILALLIGFLVAGLSNYEGDPYVVTDNIKNAPVFSFLWMETFPLGFYGPAVIPLVISYLVTSVETIGDLTAVYEVSNLDVLGEKYPQSIQGGLMVDWFGSIFGLLGTSMPNTTFAQNNGVIGLTKCASRYAGFGCAFWLCFLGMFGKIGGIITSIPDCVLGGMTIFLFANVLASGISIAATCDLSSRRNKFILAMGMAFGVGVSVYPFAYLDQRASPYTANFWRCGDCEPALQGLRNGLSIFMSTGYCVGTAVAMFLNAILPVDAEVVYLDDTHGKTKEEEGVGKQLEEYQVAAQDEPVEAVPMDNKKVDEA